MSKVCRISGKRTLFGNRVSHAQNKTRRRFLPNLQSHKFWSDTQKRWIKVKLTAKAMRTVDRRGIDSFVGRT